jgi:uncharacterized damage-inducible protein DinB
MRELKMLVSQIVKDTWHINDGMNKVLLEYLTPETVKVEAPDKNWSIAAYLAHLASSKKWWISHINKEQAELLPSLFHKTKDTFVAETNLEKIKDVFEQVSKTMLETAERADDKGILPYDSVDLYLIHMTTHDAHHRGQILLTLRTAGYRPPSDDDFWGGWWNDQQL